MIFDFQLFFKYWEILGNSKVFFNYYDVNSYVEIYNEYSNYFVFCILLFLWFLGLNQVSGQLLMVVD